MEILRDISTLWSMIHTLILFMFLFQSRYPRKKTMTLTLSTMVPLVIVNLALFVGLGAERYGTLMLLTLSLPSCVIFYLLAKHRDGRFFFTFCMVDTVVLEIVYITNILHNYLSPDSYLMMFLLRLAAYPLLEFFVYRRLRPLYLEVQDHTREGWGIFALIGLLFYVAITLLMTYPDNIVHRPAQLPALVLLFILMPVIYIHIISTLYRQQRFHELAAQENILQLQAANIIARVEEFDEVNEVFRRERHDFRHKINAIVSLVEAGQYDEVRRVAAEYTDGLDSTRVVRHSRYPIINAVLSVYLHKAEQSGIRVKTAFAFPDQFKANETEVATALANAIENAVNACAALPAEERFIEIKVISKPKFMIMVRNSFDGQVEFDGEGLPLSGHEGHGFGTRSIAAFCNKIGGYYQFKSEGKVFTLFMYLK